MGRNYHGDGNVDRLLDAFCNYQYSKNPSQDSDPQHWDHALLFSGYDLYRGDLRTIAGYAAVKGMCTKERSCTINEGLDFGSVFVVTHELGHSLGMYHDGDNRCDLHCCIMSPTVGSGKTSWSACSVREMNIFVMQLGQRGRPNNCLMDGSHPSESSIMNVPSGQEFTLDEQCTFFHGDCWRHELKDGQKLSWQEFMLDKNRAKLLCDHLAITELDKFKWCMEGKCVQAKPSAIRKVNGGWSAWHDNGGSSSCTSECVPCSIAGQIRVRRSTRQCSKP
ncbi:unnamed protein product [Anisakis simplex]|uniref:Stall (inferred by orthology to a D. melanogaster protein) n=1 Tax=Anisakis simplex TaxID=6269 RepID=A0A0M3K1J4_ANISI|nr:unnamed protein product [Anisakis simplex]